MIKTLQIAKYEAKMSSRGWRFWLLLGLVAGISLFARRDYLLYSSRGYFLHSGYSFQHPSFWLMAAILGLGTFALAVDICGRLRKTQMDKILFPLPVGPMELMAGRFLGVLISVVPLAAIGCFSLGLWQSLYGAGVVVWQPFVMAFVLLILPLLLPLTALAITLRTYFKHDFATILLGAVLATGLWLVGRAWGLMVDFPAVLVQLENASPTLGARFALGTYVFPWLIHGLLSVLILLLAPLYLRRQHLQRHIVQRREGRGVSLFGFATLARWLTDLRFDPHLGKGFYTVLIGAVLCSALGLVWALEKMEDQKPPKLEERFTESAAAAALRDGIADTLHYAIEVKPLADASRLDLTAQLTLKIREAVGEMGFEIDPRFRIDGIECDGQVVAFEQTLEGIIARFPEVLPAEQTVTLRFVYHGRPSEYSTQYSRLNTLWYPLVWQKVRTSQKGQWVRKESDLFEAEIKLHRLPGQQGIFAGVSTASEDSRVAGWKTFYPVDGLELAWGSYQLIEENRQGYFIRFYHFPGHAYQAAIFLEEMEEQEGYVRERLGRLPFPQLTIIETPYGYIPEPGASRGWLSRKEEMQVIDRAQVQVTMPGVISLSENDISYLHEKIWLLERLDHNPRVIPFYQQLPEVLNRLHQQFYRKLISVYFDHSLHPVGEYAFWLRDHLSGYASKLLEKNLWWQRRILNFDVGTAGDLPLSVARRDSLYALHRQGTYPALERVRGEGLFRMIHHLLGEENWWNLMREIFKEHRFEDFSIDAFWELVEGFYGEDLAWFREQWVEGTALPSYQILFAEARAIENRETMGIDYDVIAHVKNHGTGRFHVPIYIETERDDVIRSLWIDGGAEATLQLRVPDRPIGAMIDPQNWVVQEPYLDENQKKRSHSFQKVQIRGDER